MSQVIVICPNQRRITVKVTPSKTLQSILDEACKKQGYSPASYNLAKQGKALDLSLSFRLSGLPNNCHLEAVERAEDLSSESKEVQIGVQLSEGGRKIGKFKLNDHLFSVLHSLDESLLDVNEDGTSFPTIQYLTQKVIGEISLKNTKLSNLGIRDNTLLRYSRTKLNADGIGKLNAEVARQQTEAAQLDSVFESKRKENEERDAMIRQREMDALVDIAQREAAEEEAKKKAEAEAEQEQEKLKMERRQEQPSSSSTSASTAPAGRGGAESDSNVSSPPSKMRHESTAREEELRQLLNIVDSSLETGRQLPFDMIRPATNDRRRNPHSSAQGGNQQADVSAPAMDVSEFQDFKFPEATRGVDLRVENDEPMMSSKPNDSVSQTCSSTGVIDNESLKDRQIVAYRIQSESSGGGGESAMDTTGGDAAGMDEDFFQLTVKELAAMQRQLRQQSAQAGTLLTRTAMMEMKAQNRRRKLAAWKFSVVRILFPDRTGLQMTFKSAEPVNKVYEEVSKVLSSESAASGASSFKLSIPPNVRIENRTDKSVFDSELSPCATLVFQSANSAENSASEYLKDELLANAQTLLNADAIAKNILSQNDKFIPYEMKISTDEGDEWNGAGGGLNAASAGGSRQQKVKSGGGAIPAWLAKGKKK